jgi:CBS domain containing-hemolysin-like protein
MEEELDCKLDYEDSETVGGFVLEKLGRIPQKGEMFEEAQGTFQVTEIKGNRILRVKFALSKSEQDKIASYSI